MWRRQAFQSLHLRLTAMCAGERGGKERFPVAWPRVFSQLRRLTSLIPVSSLIHKLSYKLISLPLQNVKFSHKRGAQVASPVPTAIKRKLIDRCYRPPCLLCFPAGRRFHNLPVPAPLSASFLSRLGRRTCALGCKTSHTDR